ncbi:MAG TPA: hypothetical protein VHT75_15610 [Acidimicrobiales bacterium]|jgi:hypothetical protein|nr:hypothetical protein [Acidimicrobiales bacterium]
MVNAGATGPPPARALAQLLTIDDQTDENGRLLLEDSASGDAQRAARRRGIPMQSGSSPYRDTPSRFGGRMNVSAYEAFRPDVAGVLDGFAWLAEQRSTVDAATPASAQRLYEASYLGLTLPLVLLHRAVAPFRPHDELPAVVASIFKASRGLFAVAVAMRNDGVGRHEELPAAAVVDFAERGGHFVRRQPRRVCAAPTRLIERTIGVILTGGGADAAASQLPEWVAFASLWRCYRVQDELSEALSTYRYVMDQLTRSAPASRPEQLFPRLVPGSPGTFGQLTEAVLAHANSAQAQLNRLLGRAGDAPPIGFPDLLRLL